MRSEGEEGSILFEAIMKLVMASSCEKKHDNEAVELCRYFEARTVDEKR